MRIQVEFQVASAAQVLQPECSNFNFKLELKTHLRLFTEAAIGTGTQAGTGTASASGTAVPHTKARLSDGVPVPLPVAA